MLEEVVVVRFFVIGYFGDGVIGFWNFVYRYYVWYVVFGIFEFYKGGFWLKF